MSKKTRRLSNQTRRQINAVKQVAAFTRAIQLVTQYNESIAKAKEFEDQGVVRQLMRISNQQSRDQKIPSKRRYDADTCPALLMQPCTSQERAAQLIEASEPLCYLGDMPLYR